MNWFNPGGRHPVIRFFIPWLLALMLGVGGYVLAVPNAFTDGTVISAAAVNANFADLQAQITALQAKVAENTPPGTMIPFAGGAVPTGWLLCDGAALDRTLYAPLFAAIGTAWGAQDAASFNLPDLRGRFLRGVTGTSANDPDAATRTASNPGGNAGNAVGSVQGDVYAAHLHSMPFSYINFNSSWSDILVADGTGAAYLLPGNSNTAGNGGNETRPRNAAVNYIIKH